MMPIMNMIVAHTPNYTCSTTPVYGACLMRSSKLVQYVVHPAKRCEGNGATKSIFGQQHNHALTARHFGSDGDEEGLRA